ncbi:MAG: response regulator transcription factor, partial [Rhodobacteraceae bacterium]|nr:response regulator transcription factor [Paracoccaceae bacterium]
MKILLVEDDTETGNCISTGLKSEGHSVKHVTSGRDALVQASLKIHDHYVIDRMMPELDGQSLVKPFSLGELSARIHALARRPALSEETTSLQIGDLTLDLIIRPAVRDGQEINLLPREFLLLKHLMERPGRVQTRSMLLESVWDINFDPKTSVVETHISRLRAKIDKPFDTPLLHTLHGIG